MSNNIVVRKWQNYGDLYFIEHGGCLVKQDTYQNGFHIISLTTHIYDYKGKYKKPMIVAKCYIDLTDWLRPEDEGRLEMNRACGFDDDYIPQSLDEKMSYCIDLVNYYGLHEFDPDFPSETGCSCYALGTLSQWIVGKKIAQRFMREYGVPRKLCI